MDRDAAFRLLSSDNAHDRLRAARYLSRHATSADHDALQKALAIEEVVWIKRALRQSLERSVTFNLVIHDEPDLAEPKDDPTDIDDVYAQAIEEVTRRLVHEIEPIIGAARYYATKEISDYQKSRTKRELERLESLLRAIHTLSKAAESPNFRECDLAEQIKVTADSESLNHTVKLEMAGPSPLVAETDDSLVKLVVGNGIRNAIEATEAAAATTVGFSNRVVLTWGETDRDYWIAIVDWGSGPPVGIDRMFEIGSTTKKNHLGMGLAIAERAALSLKGKVTLTPREDRGTKFEFRWPRSKAATE
jgi:signal transduction histidine kinase